MISRPGTYALIMEAVSPFERKIGRLGIINGQPGYYIYCGSAFGPGGIKARTDHHRRISPKPHWHIDYLRYAAIIREIWYSFDLSKREHDWTKALVFHSDCSIPFPGFGASDCACKSHLVYSLKKPSFHGFVRTIHRTFATHHRISRQILTAAV